LHACRRLRLLLWTLLHGCVLCCTLATLLCIWTVTVHMQNLSEEVEVEEFYEFFSKFGKILQCKTEMDQFGQVRHWTSAAAGRTLWRPICNACLQVTHHGTLWNTHSACGQCI